VLLGNGNGTFQAPQSFVTGSRGYSVAVADFNGDGMPDLAVTGNVGGGSVALLLGQRNAATHLQVLAPSPVTAGVSFTITVNALTAGNQLDCNYTGTVTFTSSDPSAMLPAPYTFTLADGGTHTFMVTLNTSGMQTITATGKAKGSKSIKGKATVTVNSAPPVPSPAESRSSDTAVGPANSESLSGAGGLAALLAADGFPTNDSASRSSPASATRVGRPVNSAAALLTGTLTDSPGVRVVPRTDAVGKLPPEADETSVGLRLADLEAFFAAEALATGGG
jgi:hypothetical protein